MLIERAPVLLSWRWRTRSQTPRVSTALTSRRNAADVLDDARGQRARKLEVRAARAFVRKVVLQVGRPFARRALSGQEILAQPVHQQARHPERLLVVYRLADPRRRRRSVASTRNRERVQRARWR